MKHSFKTIAAGMVLAIGFSTVSAFAQAPATATQTDSASAPKKRSRKAKAADTASAPPPAAAAAPAPVAPTPATPAAPAAPAMKKTAPAPAANASAGDISSAQASGKVWVNTDTGVYHKGGRWYGKTKQGKFMTEADAQKAGYHEAKKEIGSK